MEQDQISDLPKTILHDILSRLPEKDAARTSVFSKYMSRDVDYWMKLASESGVGVLKLHLPDGPQGNEESQDRCYILPTDEQAIEHFFSCYPLIEHITLKCCFVLNRGGTRGLVESGTSMMHSIRMLGLPKLKEVDVQGIQEVIIDAPSLEDFCFCPGDDLNAPFKIDIDKCINLRGLNLWSLKSTTITDKWFLDLFPKFPFLDGLQFVNCTMSETINISSAKLKHLESSDCSNLKEVNVDAPNLVSCGYCGDGDSKPVISFPKSSSQLEVNVLIHIHFMDLGNLREIIQNFRTQNLLVLLSLVVQQPIAWVL
ncbi:hypothetical protein Fmac_012429 [Flemingia macrophylla]|uniref:F-box domain-containing protein n=1 Tax=Flemingia macrophylla TaxID=520843 RepID=A0ABD1MR52_9FABA